MTLILRRHVGVSMDDDDNKIREMEDSYVDGPLLINRLGGLTRR